MVFMVSCLLWHVAGVEPGFFFIWEAIQRHCVAVRDNLERGDLGKGLVVYLVGETLALWFIFFLFSRSTELKQPWL